MLTAFARPFIKLGEEINAIRALFYMTDPYEEDPGRKLDDEEKKSVIEHLERLLEQCKELTLPISEQIIKKRIKDIPQSGREFETLIDTLYAEIKDKLFVFVPQHLRKYFNIRKIISDKTKNAFPNAYQEIREAGKCLSLGRHTAAVFHCMRAVEIGLRAMAASLNVSFQFPLEQADWESLINKIENKVISIKDWPKSAKKDEDQKFYSAAAMQFRYFKDGWRIRTNHARETYDEEQSMSVMEHTVTFFETLSTRLSEPGDEQSTEVISQNFLQIHQRQISEQTA